MADLQTEAVGTDQLAAIDSMFGNATSVTATDSDDAGGDSTDESSDAESEQIEAGDSESQDAEPAAEAAQTTEAPPAEPAQDRQAEIDKLAKEFGLDPNNPAHLKAIERLLGTDKRNADKDKYIQELRAKLDGTGYLTEWEKAIQSRQGQQPAAAQPAAARAAQQQAYSPVPQFADGFDHWGNDPEKAITELNDAYQKGDLPRANNIESALFMRRFHAIALPRVEQLVYRAIQDLTGRDLAPVLDQVRSREEERQDIEARDFAIAELERDPAMKEILAELMSPVDGVIEHNGRKMRGNGMQRIFARNPHVLEMRAFHPNPRVAAVQTWLNRFKFAASQHLNERAQVPPVKQLKEGFQAGVQVAKQEAAQNKIRQAVNGTSKGSGRPLSADNEFLAGLSRTSGTTGKPMASMFRNFK